MKKDTPKQRSAVVRDLHSPKYKQRVVRDKKKYTRKEKHRRGNTPALLLSDRNLSTTHSCESDFHCCASSHAITASLRSAWVMWDRRLDSSACG